MFSTTDTIAAIATPPGRGGIGVVRISGPDAHRVARELTTHGCEFAARQATFTRIRTGAPTDGSRRAAENGGGGGSSSGAIDHGIVTYFPTPNSYTGEDVVEISAHGSPAVLKAIVAAAVTRGARVAEPGEFTLRAFLNGRIDLLQAEAIADIVDAVTPLQARVAFDQLEGTLTGRISPIDGALFDLIARLEASVDFPDEGYQFVEPQRVARELADIDAQLAALAADAHVGRMVREGVRISIVGRPNVGKSSIFNALVGVARAIVTEVPGTTRDLVSEVVDLDGLAVTLVDTAGMRETADRIEAIGVDLARRTQHVSDLILVVVDSSQPLCAVDLDLAESVPAERRLVVANKADLAPAWQSDALHGCVPAGRVVAVSALTGAGVQELRTTIARTLDDAEIRERPSITNVRHAALVDRARQAVGRARSAIGEAGGAMSEEFVLADLQDARGALEEIVGRRAPEDLLTHIFSRFCIGK